MKSTATARKGKNNYWNPCQFKPLDRILTPTGGVVTIANVGVKYCADTDGKTHVMKRCKSLPKDEPNRVQLQLL